MSRVRDKSISYTLRKDVLTDVTGCTEKTYGNSISKFSSWCDDNGIHTMRQLKEAGTVETVQTYCNMLVEKGLSPWTIHTYISPICKGLGFRSSEIEKPKRTVDKITRGRDMDANPQGRVQASESRFGRFVELGQAVGIRKSELSRLRGRDLVRDPSTGKVFVEVEKGKGGKRQLQEILPDKVETVEKIMGSVAPDAYVFTKEEINNKIEVHQSARASLAREAYDYYKQKVDENPSYKEVMRREMVARYDAVNDPKRPGAARHRAEFLKETYNDMPYKLRGESVEVAEKNHRPTTLDRTVALYVSVFYGAHFRIGVEVIHYLIS